MTEIVVRKAEDLIEAITLFMQTAPPFERAKLGGFFEGYVTALANATNEQEDHHDDSSRG